jgi:hypothetical protein
MTKDEANAADGIFTKPSKLKKTEIATGRRRK